MKRRDPNSVGVREFKASLSAYLRRVRHGESIVVTDRGEPVARILPVGIADGLARLVAEGKLTWSGRKPKIVMPTVRMRGSGPSASEMLVEDRDSRARSLDTLSRPTARRRRTRG